MKGPVNSSPGALAAPAAWWTVSTGGCRLGWERKRRMSAGVPGATGNSFSAITAGVAIVKVSDSLRVLRLDACHLACTVTRAPGMNAWLGTKLAPGAEL